MLFNSKEFAIFLPIIFALYWIIPARKIHFQNILLLAASYFFYAFWDWRFLFLLLFSTLLDYFSGIIIAKTDAHKKRKMWLFISVFINLGFLGVFKYFNFFIDSFVDTLALFGINAHLPTLSILLPVGISFYTFHGLSYVVDIYKKRINAEKNVVNYGLFVSFFPLLVAGPIERATHLLPQIKSKRTFNYSNAIIGLRQILWGLVKKIVIADSCAEIANMCFNEANTFNGFVLVVGAIAFSIQIYGDFSGYTDIALGTARLLGFELLQNFSFPYFSRSIAEFWRRWHISLSTWFRDYVYIPMGGSKNGLKNTLRNTFVLFLVSGFWHGANWTFVIWGLLHAIYFMPLVLLKRNRSHLGIVAENSFLPTFKETIGMVSTFLLTTFAWIFFRAASIEDAFLYIERIFTVFTKGQTIEQLNRFDKVELLWIVPIFFLIEWIGRRERFAIEKSVDAVPRFVRFTFYYICVVALFYFGGKEEQFIYFQF